jgi:hypothetical protein
VRLITGMADTNKLVELNENTFKAEAKEKIGDEDWDKFLWRVLADDFRIRRANPAILPQDKHKMIVHIRYDKSAKRNFSDVKVFEDGDFGLVTSIVTLEGQDDRFHNIKVFTRQNSGDWQCVYWRVVRLTRQ